MLSKIYRDLLSKGMESDKGTAHSYINFYEGLFYTYKNKQINLLEIGIYYGYSCALWKEYFKNATIYGMDTYKIQKYTDGYIFIHGDGTKLEDRDLYVKHKKFDIIIDDGSHLLKDQIATFELYWPLLNNDGLFIIEDVYDIENNYNSYKEVFDRNGANFDVFDMRHIKGRIDDVLIVLKK